MGWKSVDRLDIGKGGKRDQYRGKKPDKLGRWHSADVRHYSTNPAGAYLIAPRMKELALWERYVKELSKMSRTKGLLVDWGHCLTLQTDLCCFTFNRTRLFRGVIRSDRSIALNAGH
jgi:hypothetical protein